MDSYRVVVHLFNTAKSRKGPTDTAPGGVHNLVDAVDHIFGSKGLAIMPIHPTAQKEGVSFAVGAYLPALGQIPLDILGNNLPLGRVKAQ